MQTNQIVLGILAHVDAGKTTLSEAILYETGVIKHAGRVDNQDTLLDHEELEKKRGITIFSKEAVFAYENTNFSLLDTPGHTDFSAEMERTLSVLDYAILVISATDGVQSHTKTLWRLLREYEVPTFLFVNKMDQPGNEKHKILAELKLGLSDHIVDFSENSLIKEVQEEIAVLSGDEQVLEDFLETDSLSTDVICNLIRERKAFPCYFGSALRQEGVTGLLNGLSAYTISPDYPEEFGARIYKITRDINGNRLTHLKLTGGALRVKMPVDDEKIEQIRIYNGSQFKTIPEATAGMICTVTGLNNTRAGMGIGYENSQFARLLEPVLTYSLKLPAGILVRKAYQDIKLLEEEMPELSVYFDEESEIINVKLMGEIQIQILQDVIKKRFGFVPEFGMGSITYKETIRGTVIGVGHFEPLRHYAEVHLRIEEAPLGSGIEVLSDCSEDILDKNWQRLIATHVKEREHAGVLTGSCLTDVKISIINGRAHKKHTEGGDFRQATYRAIRQGLMQAENVLLEPYYDFILEVPRTLVGKAIADLETMHCNMNPMEIMDDTALLTGYGPVYTLRDYQIHLNAYTKGLGKLTVTYRGYDICHNQEQIVLDKHYNPEEDLKNPVSSVFCEHGSGFLVPWDQVFLHMHVFDEEMKDFAPSEVTVISRETFDYSIGLDEIDAIFNKTFHANTNAKKNAYQKRKTVSIAEHSVGKSTSAGVYRQLEPVLLVDGYNVIFAWDELNALAKDNVDAAKDKLISILSNYASIIPSKIYLIFDGYKKKGNVGSEVQIHDIMVVHTKEGETADAYIERFAHTNRNNYRITVASSDGLIQTIVRGEGGYVISSRELYSQIEASIQELRETYNIQSID